MVAVCPRTWHDGRVLRVGMRAWTSRLRRLGSSAAERLDHSSLCRPVLRGAASLCQATGLAAAVSGAAQAQGTGLYGDKPRAALICLVRRGRRPVLSLLLSRQSQ
jgi:hypothetical protein